LILASTARGPDLHCWGKTVLSANWFSGKEMVISPSRIDRISYEDSMVFVNLTKEAILEAPEFHVPTVGKSG
jgi:hypothetical protein